MSNMCVGDYVRVAFDSPFLEPGQFIEAKIFSIVGWDGQTNFHLDLPNSCLYSVDEEEVKIDRDASHLIMYADSSIEFFEQCFQGIPCTVSILRSRDRCA